VWAKTGSRPTAVRDYGFESAYIFGAICPISQKGSAMVFSGVGAVEMNIHLNEISKTIPSNVHAVIIMDRAPWHKSVTIPSNISIIYLPPYSPELNPVEQVWDYLRSNYLSNRAYSTLDDVFEACCSAWNFFVNQPSLINSIGMRTWASMD
jgi:transposase